MTKPKTSSSKKPAAAKSAPAKKPAPAKKAPAAAKKPAATKAEQPQPAAPAAKPKKKDFVRKPITVVKKTPKMPLKKPEVAVAFENTSQDLAFAFAESMKQRQREADRQSGGDRDSEEVRLSRRPTSRTKGQSSMQFSKADLDEFRTRLIMLRQETLGQSETLRTVALEQTDDRGGEDADGSDAFMRLQNLSQVDSQNKVVQKIDEALHRIDDGTYGICEVCGQLIRKPRLVNMPFVHTCMECQTAMESPLGKR